MILKRALEPGVDAYLIMFQSLDCIIQVSTTSVVYGDANSLVSATLSNQNLRGGAQESVF